MYVNIDVTMATEFYNLQLPMSALIDFRAIMSVKNPRIFLSWSVSFWCLFKRVKLDEEMKILFYVNTFKTAAPQNDNDEVM